MKYDRRLCRRLAVELTVLEMMVILMPSMMILGNRIFAGFIHSTWFLVMIIVIIFAWSVVMYVLFGRIRKALLSSRTTDAPENPSDS